MFYVQHKEGVVVSVGPERQFPDDVEITTSLADGFYSGLQRMENWSVRNGKMVCSSSATTSKATLFPTIDLPVVGGRVVLPHHLRHKKAYYVSPLNPNIVISSTVALNDVRIHPDTLLVVGGVMINAC